MNNNKPPRMQLPAPWPRMSQEQIHRVADALNAGCLFCFSTKAVLCKRQKSNGSHVVQLQCCGCGNTKGGSFPRSGHPQWESYPDYDATIWQRYQKALDEQRQDARMQWFSDYSQDLQMPEWRRLADAVLDRAGHKCEACLIARATIAHHEAYSPTRPYWRVPAFHIRAVCRVCHDRIHDRSNRVTL